MFPYCSRTLHALPILAGYIAAGCRAVRRVHLVSLLSAAKSQIVPSRGVLRLQPQHLLQRRNSFQKWPKRTPKPKSRKKLPTPNLRTTKFPSVRLAAVRNTIVLSALPWKKPCNARRWHVARSAASGFPMSDTLMSQGLQHPPARKPTRTTERKQTPLTPRTRNQAAVPIVAAATTAVLGVPPRNASCSVPRWHVAVIAGSASPSLRDSVFKWPLRVSRAASPKPPGS